jgi:thiol-disulfide isomerase/thioredoxin
MNKNTGIIIGVIALSVIVGGVYVSMNNKDDIMMAKEKMEQQAMENAKMAEEKAMMKKDETSMMDKTDTMMKVGSYETYSADKIVRAETGDVVLFFHASWCPSCRGLNSSIENNLKSIPEGVTILKTDYDKETELKKKYGVTYQHTLVQVDKDGNMINKWSGGGNLDNLLSQIQ